MPESDRATIGEITEAKAVRYKQFGLSNRLEHYRRDGLVIAVAVLVSGRQGTMNPERRSSACTAAFLRGDCLELEMLLRLLLTFRGGRVLAELLWHGVNLKWRQ
jgi:hypothetical protein